MAGHTVDIDVRAGIDGGRALARALEAPLGAMLTALGAGPFELSVVLTDDVEIAGINGAWRGRSVPTDVLSFPQQEGPLGPGPLGDVVVSVPYAARQAAEVGHALEDELRVLCAHGIAHLAGLDHETEADRVAMEAVERRLLRAAGGGTGLVARAGLEDPGG